jgi:hypothetical protein
VGLERHVLSPAADEILIRAENEAAFQIVEENGPWVRGRFKFTTGGPVSAARYRKMARALWKATLECMYLDHGEMTFESRFDEVREMVIGSRPASGFIIFPKQTARRTRRSRSRTNSQHGARHRTRLAEWRATSGATNS